MAEANLFFIGANDEHGQNPATAGKRTPVIPTLNRSFYENEFNRPTKNYFIEALLRIGFVPYNVKPELQDVSISTRVARINAQRLTALVTFAYNAFGDGKTFNEANGYEVFYSTRNQNATQSRLLGENIINKMQNNLITKSRGLKSILGVGVLDNTNCTSSLIEAGFMTNIFDAALMLNPTYQIDVAEYTAVGICSYYGVNYFDRENLQNYDLVKKGDRGRFVTLLQYNLNNYNYALSTDGAFGTKTQNAVFDFQKRNNLVVDGIVGKNTWIKLINLNPQNFLLKKGSRESAVYFLQRMLLSKFYPLQLIDGIFGTQTENIVKQFQKNNNLVADGIVGKNTWAKILDNNTYIKF